MTTQQPDRREEQHKCDLCFEHSDMQFNITENAAFFACAKHAKALSDIIYPIGDKLAAEKLPLLMEKLRPSPQP